MKFFQIPGLQESHESRDPQAFIQHVIRSKAFNEEAYSDANLSPMIHQVATFGLKGGINYYRARSRFPLKHDTHRFIETPTKLFWGVEDPFLHSSLADSKANAEYVAKLDIERIENAGHWSHWDLPERINDGLRRHWEAVAG